MNYMEKEKRSKSSNKICCSLSFWIQRLLWIALYQILMNIIQQNPMRKSPNTESKLQQSFLRKGKKNKKKMNL